MNSVSVFSAFALLVSHFMCQFLQSILTIRAECDPISWILETGKELERSCDFAMALKYYFAGRMFCARLKLSRQLQSLPDAWKQKFRRYENEFKVLYDSLLPMTNAQASFTAFAFHSMSHSPPFPNHPPPSGLRERSRVRSLPKRGSQARYHEQMSGSSVTLDDFKPSFSAAFAQRISRGKVCLFYDR